MTYPRTRQELHRTQLDRQTWAGTTQVVLSYDTVGSGPLITERIDFGTVFQDRPFFAYGVELQPGEVLVDNDYPFVTCGVSQYERSIIEEEDNPNVLPQYLGAFVFINVMSGKQYRLRFRLSFEGIGLRNVEYLRGT